MRSYFVTLGFNETFLLRLLSETSAREDDSLTIIVPSPISSGTEAALDNLKVQAERLYGLTPRVVEISLEGSFVELLGRVLDQVLVLAQPIITDLTLGMRMLDSLILTALIVTGKEFQAYVRDESGGGKVISFGKSEINALMRQYSVEEMRLLDALRRTGDIRELASTLGKSEKTLQNKVSELKRFGIVTMVGRDRKVRLTPLGECVMKLVEGRTRS